MISKSQRNNFKQKVFGMNNNPTNSPVEVTRLDYSLLELARKIKPDESVIKEHRSYVQSIAELLKRNSNYDIDRILFAGSFGKRTNVLKSDADCVLFINNQEPPFNQIIKEFYEICKKPAVQNSFDSFNITLNRNSINLDINGFEMDVVLATNFVKDLKKHQSLAHIQQKEALQRIKLNPTKNNYPFSSALAEATVYFMKTRVGFANEMARIAKYWFKSLGSDVQDISGSSTFIELVAVYAARKGRRGNRKHNPYLKAFIRFLDKLINFEQLNVSFKRCNVMFQHHPPNDSAMPRVIDPVNPYNNFASYWCEDRVKIEALKSCAADTLQQLQQLVLNPSTGKDPADVLFH